MATCWECGQERKRVFDCETCGAPEHEPSGPITGAMLHTALRKCAYETVNPRDHYDIDQLARIINGWLEPVTN